MGDRAAKTALSMRSAQAPKAWPAAGASSCWSAANGERTVEALAGEVGLSVANTSQHLQILRQAGLVSSRREGTSVHYRLAAPEVFELWRTLRTLAASRLAEVERLTAAYLGSRDELEPVTREELARRLQDDDLVVLDVRPATEYAAGHLPGAVSIPVGELRRRLAERPLTGDRWPTAAAPTGASLTRPLPCCARLASRPGRWRMGCRNGRPPGWSSPAADHGSSQGALSCPPSIRSSTKGWAIAPMWSSWATGGPWWLTRPATPPHTWSWPAGGGSRSPTRLRPTCTPTS